MNRRPPTRGGEAGFTLIELMISLGLFALIAVAGLGMVQGILNVQGRTEKRLDRLAEVQRTMFVLSSDLDQIAFGRITGDAQGLSFTRAAPGSGGEAVSLRYAVAGGALVRMAGPLPQLLLPGVTAARWRFWDVQAGAGGWVDHWPLSDDQADRWPRAIEVEMQVGGAPGPAGALRRVIVLPTRPEAHDAPA
ncbi:MAG: type II secretion system protein GspJ [Sphingomonas sp.]